MAKKKREEAHGGHGWFVTFADLMALLLAFFVMLVAFSTQDSAKLKIVAGSMRDAFGVQTESRYSGIVESDGLPTRPKLKNVEHISPEDSSNTPTPDEKDRQRECGARLKVDREFALASASLRQALQDMPELTEMSKHIMFEETKEGLNLEIVDQDGRSMFADGSKVPYDRTRRLIQKLAVPLKATPLRVNIVGHTVGRLRAGAQRIWRVRPVGGPRQRRAPDPRTRGAAAVPHLRGRRQGRQPAAVSRRSDIAGKPSRHHHIDARKSAAAAQSEAVSRTDYHNTISVDCRSALRQAPRRRRCYACPMIDRHAEASIAARINSTTRTFLSIMTVSVTSTEAHEGQATSGFWALTLGSIGVVFGDIGTSPLYAFREAVTHAANGPAGVAHHRARRALADPVVAVHRRHRQICAAAAARRQQRRGRHACR